MVEINVEAASEQIDELIERRAGERKQANERAAIDASHRQRHADKQREQNRWEWIRFFEHMAASHAKVSEDYRQRAHALINQGEGGSIASG